MSKPKANYPRVIVERPPQPKIEKVVIELSCEQATNLRHLMYFTGTVPEALKRDGMFNKEFTEDDLVVLMTKLHSALHLEMESI